MGATDLATSTVITTQPSLGSLYKSQNTDTWTEDLDQDLKFKLYRAEFDNSRPCELLLKNVSLGYELLEKDPIETDATSASIATSQLFKNNNSIIKINHRDNGFEDSGNSYVFFRGADEAGGIPSETYNTNLFRVANAGVDSYTIRTITNASRSSVSGGHVYATYNRKFEVLYPQVHYLTVSGTKLEASVKTTNIIPIDSSTTNYTSYSQSGFEKTFLNEAHYFENQKVIASEINETLNDLDRSITYKIDLSSEVSYLSPVIDLASASLKTVSNRIENASGQENRYGRRNQLIEFYPVFSFTLSTTTPGVTYQNNQSVKGKTSAANGTIAKVDGNQIWVKVKTKQGFVIGEEVELTQFASSQSAPTVTVGSSPSQVTPIINSSTQSAAGEAITIVARNPVESKILETYDNKITGKSIVWNRTTRVLTLRTDVQPINDNYTARIIDSTLYSRRNEVADQIADIFRVGDIISYPDQPDDEAFLHGSC